MKKIKHTISMVFAAILTMTLPAAAMAATAPTSSNTLGYQIYDIFFNQVYGSGGGYAVGVIILFWAATRIKADWKEAAFLAVGGSVVLGIPSLATALGSVVI